MRALSSVTPSPEQLKVLADVRPGFRIIRVPPVVARPRPLCCVCANRSMSG